MPFTFDTEAVCGIKLTTSTSAAPTVTITVTGGTGTQSPMPSASGSSSVLLATTMASTPVIAPTLSAGVNTPTATPSSGTEGRWAYSFIGSQLNISFTPEQLLGDRIVPGQNTSSAGGPNWVQELTGCKEGHPRDCEKQLWGFAYAGADISTTL
ncbi:hypothetical protein COL5a_004103 [Colletotrichum fioriniae]|nr:hypothetical protein COL5a_004103 [Colletotrichum fioriniae]